MGYLHTVLNQFHPLVAQWFRENVGEPTDLQTQAWPLVASGEHVLITAPTGSGKTLAAFLSTINQLISGERPLGRTSTLYVSPLKALNNDVQRNLLRPLAELEGIFRQTGEPFPAIQVLTRSGDTPQSDRRRMLHHPPEILITTPESLNLLLSSPGGRSILTGLSTVIMDEIHAVVDSKRGVHLMTAVDRLVLLSGEFQRIALSATVRPPEAVAEFVGGYKMEGDFHSPRYTPRPMRIVESSQKKHYRLRVRFPEPVTHWSDQDSFWKPFVHEVKEIINRNRSTLIFTNSRRLCEKLTYLINEGETTPLSYAHHGSLSREIRTEVEKKLKEGTLRAIVATNSLELGIDIGLLDEVVLIQSPASFSSTIQRIGRSGHRVGEVSRGTLLPLHAQDLLEGAVLAAGVLNQDIEPIIPVQSPLDVLAQIIVSMTGVETWDVDELYAILKATYPYHTLSRPQFDLVVNMLAGRYAGSRLRELKPRIAIDRLSNTLAARKGALQAVYFSGGTIPDRGYFHLRHNETNARIGELDEEFVWEAAAGQAFTLSTQNWRIERITHNDVFVVPVRPGTAAPPFWKAEDNLRGFHLAERIGELLEAADERVADPQFKSYLEKVHCLEPMAAEELITFLKEQKGATGSPLPHRHHVLLEYVKAGPGGYPGNEVVLHTMWGGRVNRPFAMALDAAWEDRYGYRLELYVSNDCIMLLLPHEVPGEEILSLVTSVTVQDLLRKRLEGSGFFGARFRECAGRALLLTRRKMNERMPLWLSRLRSQKLLDSVLQYEDFPILLETWRTCLKDEFDLEALLQVLSELESGAITWSEVHTGHPSPMARGVTWRQINQYMYMDDVMRSGKASRLRSDLLHEVALTPELRPPVPSDLAERFGLKRRRLSSGYSPDTSMDLLEWIKERMLLPDSEWQSLLQAIKKDHVLDPGTLIEPIKDKLVWIHLVEAAEPLIAALEMLPKITCGFYGGAEILHTRKPGKYGAALTSEYSGTKDAAADTTISTEHEVCTTEFSDEEASGEDRDELFTTLLSDWLQFYGPRTIDFVQSTLGLESGRVRSAVEALIDSGKLVSGRLIKESEDEAICDSENYEILLRMMRAEARPAFEPLDIKLLQLFLSRYQGITSPEDDEDGLFRRIEQLVCYPATAELWDSEIFPVRLKSYDLSWIDSIMHQTDLLWIGIKNHRICFCFEPDLDLVVEEAGGRGRKSSQIGEFDPSSFGRLFPDSAARYDFSALLHMSKLEPAELSEKLWRAVWRGEVTNDTFTALRRGIENRFKLTDMTEWFSKRSRRRHRGSSRIAFSMWKGSLPTAGNWQLIAWPPHGDDLTETEERNKDRVRLLLDRYGIVFRELLQNELPAFSWSNVFRALRLMELSGEVLTGYFFHGIPGPQFISHEAFRMLQRRMPDDAVYWMSATDPASLCGIRLDGLKGKLPRRVAGTHLVYHGNRLVLVSRRNGKILNFHVHEDDPNIQTYLGVLHHLLRRKFQPSRNIVIETINGENAAQSPYADTLRTSFDVHADFKSLILYRRHT